MCLLFLLHATHLLNFYYRVCHTRGGTKTTDEDTAPIAPSATKDGVPTQATREARESERDTATPPPATTVAVAAAAAAATVPIDHSGLTTTDGVGAMRIGTTMEAMVVVPGDDTGGAVATTMTTSTLLAVAVGLITEPFCVAEGI